MLLEIAATIFSATCNFKSFADAATRLLEADAGMDRVALIGSLCLSRQRVFSGVSRVSAWEKHSPRRYEARSSRPAITPEFPAQAASAAADVEQRDEKYFPKVTDHRDVKVHSVIDAHLWDRAAWAGTAFGTLDLMAPPFLAFMFRDNEAATKIFERWRDRFGMIDKGEEIHIGIVRRFTVEHPAHYGMVVTSNHPTDPSAARISMLASRSLTMEPADDSNLTRFLGDFEKAGAYLFMPMLLTPGQPPVLMKEHSLLKRELHVKMAADIAPNDLENVFLKLRGLKM
ncbi:MULTISPECIES: hypothetical protein [unclassified Lysobacter]|uniref:hypothetical protein n=1 Tax=unclassified Lysobacter TaxID=2635362 RepID=UPI001BE62854|nr:MULTISPECIES: hypothetical protein [unclassified Lysobacter]MBT2747538.1 hypothetical protein [Lysobacter sp. ISL-42]MBT2752361.1 hypothetical protein [Lysobacter sp. ISL-50]MBT2776220.1 hypothetical protein [Lysobacter sp. ISL-54]MBT2784304.1 hypothetical protein [Lysobacter sp. ISL-52]